MKLAFSAASLMLCAASVAMAGDGRPTAWAYMDTGIKSYYAELAMTSDRMWPVIFDNISRQVYSLNPASQAVGFNAYQSGTWRVDANLSSSLGMGWSAWESILGPNGQMVIRGSNSNNGNWTSWTRLIDSAGQMTLLTLNGLNPTDVAFSPNGDLYLLNETQATGFPTSSVSYSSIAVSPAGLVARANAQQYQTLDSEGNIETISLPSGVSYLRHMVFDSNNQAHLLVRDTLGDADLIYTAGTESWNRVGLENAWRTDFQSSPNGITGVVEALRQVTYARYDSGSGWEDFPTISDSQISTGIGMQYDCNDSPVISYIGTNGNIWIAYDPNSIPEPTTAATFAFLLFGTYNILARQMRDPA